MRAQVTELDLGSRRGIVSEELVPHRPLVNRATDAEQHGARGRLGVEVGGRFQHQLSVDKPDLTATVHAKYSGIRPRLHPRSRVVTYRDGTAQGTT